MKDICWFCGRSIEAEDNIAWKYFGVICGNCFLLHAEYVLKNVEGMEAEEKANICAPGLYGEA